MGAGVEKDFWVFALPIQDRKRTNAPSGAAESDAQNSLLEAPFLSSSTDRLPNSGKEGSRGEGGPKKKRIISPLMRTHPEPKNGSRQHRDAKKKVVRRNEESKAKENKQVRWQPCSRKTSGEAEAERKQEESRLAGGLLLGRGLAKARAGAGGGNPAKGGEGGRGGLRFKGRTLGL